jgi:hypothetical protein
MRQIIDVPIKQIAINPYRRLHAYPYIESKIEALQRSIADVGLWPSVMARPLADDRLWKYELAFGHHRVEAARRSELKTIPLIVEPLTDMQMLQYMGRENLEDYNAVFLIQLETWEAAIKSGLVLFAKSDGRQPIAVARFLGWDRPNKDGRTTMNATASACNAVYALIQGGYNTRDDFKDISVETARNIAERVLARIEQIENVGKQSARPRGEIERTKQKYGQSAADTAAQFRSGSVTQRDLLRERKFVIQEEALFRAKRLQHRKSIQWRAIREELQEEFRSQLLSINRAQFREQINSKYDPLSVLTHVRIFLSKGNGQETAGYSFADWHRDITERKITARRNAANGWEKSADLLALEMEQRVQLGQYAKPE